MNIGKFLLWFVFLLLLGMGFRYFLYPKLGIVTGYNAKILCSCKYVSGIPLDSAEVNDLGFSLLWLAHNKIDDAEKSVRSSVLGMQSKTAVFRPGYGCTLLNGNAAEPLRDLAPKPAVDYAPNQWPNRQVQGSPQMQAALRSAFDSTSQRLLRTRAVAVVKNGRLIGEAYGDGFDQDTPLLGWSMAKSLTAALVGILVRRGDIRLDDPMPIPEWQNDDRVNITWAMALHMSTGLSWTEDYTKVSPATVMLYEEPDMGAYAAHRPLEAEPGTFWEYSSGTSNILARALRVCFDSDADYLAFPVESLFGPIGAKSFVLETDASNHFVGSSYAYATARDWARLGELFLNEGNGPVGPILDSAFVEFCRTPAPAAQGQYGGHFWLNANGAYPGYRASDYWMSGFHDQRVSIHPEDGIVIVRLGVTYDAEDFDFDGWTARVLAAARKEPA